MEVSEILYAFVFLQRLPRNLLSGVDTAFQIFKNKRLKQHQQKTK